MEVLAAILIITGLLVSFVTFIFLIMHWYKAGRQFCFSLPDGDA